MLVPLGLAVGGAEDLVGDGLGYQTNTENVSFASAIQHGLERLVGATDVDHDAIGVERFGQSGSIPDLYRAYGLDADAIVDAAARFETNTGDVGYGLHEDRKSVV